MAQVSLLTCARLPLARRAAASTAALAGWADPDPASPGTAFLLSLPEDLTTSTTDSYEPAQRL